MRIENIGNITVLYAEEHKILKSGNVYSTQVWLGVNDSIDNWSEVDISVLNEESNVLNRLDEINITNKNQDNLIDVTLCATDEMYMMIEPLLAAQPQMINEKGVSKMVDMYVAMVMRGLKTVDEVPARYREQVKEILAKLEK